MTSFGEELRRQRELRAISLREISDATKINIRFLEALEENDFKHLPGGQFNKGFIRAYARHIGVDGEEMVDSYLVELRQQENRDGVPARAAPRSGRRTEDSRAPAIVLVVAAIAALVVGIVALTWVVRRVLGGGAEAAPAASASPASVPSPREDPPAADRSGEATAPPPTPVQNEPPAPSPAAPPAAPDPIPSGKLILRVIPLEMTGMTLLCEGRPIFSGALETGRQVAFECEGVYEVSLDNAAAVNLSINGERIYLGKPGQSIAGRHVSAANYADFLTPPAGVPPL